MACRGTQLPDSDNAAQYNESMSQGGALKLFHDCCEKTKNVRCRIMCEFPFVWLISFEFMDPGFFECLLHISYSHFCSVCCHFFNFKHV